MTISRSFVLAGVLALALLTACATPTPVRNVSDAPVRTDKASVTQENVRNAIKRAGAGLGWVMLDDGPGQMTGTLHLRTHTAVVDITYNTSTYSIQYKSSTNLDYNAEKGTIHRAYNGWIKNLDTAIQRELAALY